MAWWRHGSGEPRFTPWTPEFVLTLRGTAAHTLATIRLHTGAPPPEPDQHILAAFLQHGLSLALPALLEAKALLSLEVALAPGLRDQPPEGPWRLVPALDAPVPCRRMQEDPEGLWHAQGATCCPGMSLDDPEAVCTPTCPECCRWLQTHAQRVAAP